jgi:gluconokinase
MSLKSYIIQQLTGVCKIDMTLASATGLLDIHKKVWDPATLAYVGIRSEQLPDVVPIADSCGKLLRQYRLRLG